MRFAQVFAFRKLTLSVGGASLQVQQAAACDTWHSRIPAASGTFTIPAGMSGTFIIQVTTY
ncbi:MAG: hypothetical protein ABIT83_13480 [Massilia sp.]